MTIAIREGDKLKGSTNYYVWSLKLRAMLRAESQWGITESEQNPVAFPATIDGEVIIEAHLKKKKGLACRLLILLISDDLIDLVVGYSDPALIWKTLQEQFHGGDQSQILTLMSQLQSLKMSEGGSVEEYIKKARELKNRLSSMGERLSDKNVNQTLLDGLPRSYESTIQTLTHLNSNMTFEQLSASLILESHQRAHRQQQLGDEEALAASFQ